MTGKWNVEKAQTWHAGQPWRVGCNFIPSTAVNQLEMWQSETFDPHTIGKELTMAAELGMNAVRIYLHDLAWQADPEGFKNRIDTVLRLAAARAIAVIFVFFDDCWHPNPRKGPQPEPFPGVHNSRWLNSPGPAAARDRNQWPRLKAYVQDVVTSFGQDDRILLWDVYNELGNIFLPTLAKPRYIKAPRLFFLFLRFHLLPIPTLPLFRETVRWIRQCGPLQPLTAGIYINHRKLNRALIEASDLISFHDYTNPGALKKQIKRLREHGRPLLCTEYLNRLTGSTFGSFLPIFKEEEIDCFNWGLVSGKTQTIFPWSKPGKPGVSEPEVWFHDILRSDGSAFSQEEAAFLKSMLRGTGTAGP